MVALLKRYRWWLVAVLALVLLVIRLCLVESRDPLGRLYWVRKGMTYQEVESRMGSPDATSSYGDYPCYLWKFPDHSYVWVIMDGNGRVWEKDFHGPPLGPRVGFTDRLRRLGLPF